MSMVVLLAVTRVRVGLGVVPHHQPEDGHQEQLQGRGAPQELRLGGVRHIHPRRWLSSTELLL